MYSPPNAAADRLIVALDVPSSEDALGLVRRLSGVVDFVKVGLELFAAAGPEIVRKLVSDRKKVFLDCKFLDIDETVRRAVRQAATLGASFLTVHEGGRTVAAALEGSKGTALKILAVTVLTSMDSEDLKEMGIQGSVEEVVLRRAKRAIDAGCHGVVASGREARQIRAEIRTLAPSGNAAKGIAEVSAPNVPRDFIIVTPGIRPAGADVNEQKRSVTPREAIEAGADFLVVGRPITHAPDPRAAATQIISEMEAAWAFGAKTAR